MQLISSDLERDLAEWFDELQRNKPLVSGIPTPVAVTTEVLHVQSDQIQKTIDEILIYETNSNSNAQPI